MATIREQIMESIKRRLETIRPGIVVANYTFDSAVKGVHPWRKVPLLPADCPAIIIYDTAATLQDGVLGRHTYDLAIDLIGIVSQSSPINSARNLLADMVAAIGQDYTNSGLTIDTQIKNQNLTREDAGDVVAAVELGLAVTYRAEMWRI